MLDCEPPDTDEPSEWDNGGVSVPDVTVLERERVARPGRENTRGSLTTNGRLGRALFSSLIVSSTYRYVMISHFPGTLQI